ncbi:capsid protein [Rhodoplanes elegans]|uniref:Capsid protein n=1 Tax=Rhodoplanes elegans TaxID=29408 RepID=A0A327KQA0_9BRAD|nr:capsid protein [Rhodoplanes elegans]MBK5957398.1 capsid protein [Rhodoplanes elegans]RAI39522.1 capsid protein [Rhodoplanes elegans]
MAPNRPFPVNPALTAIAVGYRNPAQTLIADDVLPRVPVGSESFKWTEYPLAEGFTVPETKVGRMGQPNRVEFTGTEKDGSTEDHGLDDLIPISDINEAARQRAAGLGNYDPRARATEGLTDLLQLAREIRVAGIVHAAATYAAGRKVTLSGTSQFSDYTNSDPIGVIKAALEGTLVYRPNTLVLGHAVWSKLSSHPHLVNAVRGNLTNKGVITREEFAALFEVRRVLVGESYVNTAKKGQAASLARVWGKHIACLYIDPAATTQRGITFGFTAQVGTRIAGSVQDPNIGLEGGERVRVGEKVRELIVAQDVGYFIENAVA